MPILPPKIIFRVMAGIWIILVERREEDRNRWRFAQPVITRMVYHIGRDSGVRHERADRPECSPQPIS